MLAYDLAVCLNAWCFEPDFSFNVTRARALLRGYGAVRTLTDGEAAALPVLAQGAGAALPADPAVRLAEHAGGRPGGPQGPAGLSAAAAFSPGRTGVS